MTEKVQDTADGDRIAKVLARAGVCSRRDAERMIAEGRVAVDGKALATPAFKVVPGARITVDGKPVSVERGPGILQGVPVASGDHRVEGRYSPPGLVAGGIVTLMSLIGLLGVRWRFS